MDLRLELDDDKALIVHLRDGDTHTTVAVAPWRAGIDSLRRSLDAAMTDGYGECFWPGRTGGQYWWVFKRDAETLETIAMWTRGGAALWEHVFRAADAATHIRDRFDEEAARLGT